MIMLTNERYWLLVGSRKKKKKRHLGSGNKMKNK